MWKMFKENNQRILKSIAEYRNCNDETGDNEESNRDYTQEIKENSHYNIDFKFYYENCLTTMSILWNEKVK